MSEDKLSVADVLERAADLIEPEGKWTRYVLARDADHRAVKPTDSRAVCFCMEGAILRTAADAGMDWTSASHPAAPLVTEIVNDRAYGSWNDRSGRKQKDAVKALREAAALARESSQ